MSEPEDIEAIEALREQLDSDGNAGRVVGLDAEALQTFNEALYDAVKVPDPPPRHSSKEIMHKYKEELEKYSKEMMDAFTETGARNEVLWYEVTSSFRPETFGYMSKATTVRWIDYLINNGVWVRRQHCYRRARAFVDCLQHPRFIPSQTGPPATSTPLDSETIHPAQRMIQDKVGHRSQQHDRETAFDRMSTSVHHSRAKRLDVAPASTGKADAGGEEVHKGNDAAENAPHEGLRNVLPNVYENSFRGTRHGSNSQGNSGEHSNSGYANGFNNMLKACKGRCSYGGGFDEDLQGALDFYDSMARMFLLSDEEKAEALPAILCDDALQFYMKKYRVGDSYTVILQKLIDNYINPEQRNRTLILWQSIRLSQSIRENPSKSELEVFRSFCHRLVQLQNQLDPAYRTDTFLRDQLIVSTDTSQIAQSLRERVPTSSQEARSRIATFRSNEPRSAEAFVASQQNPRSDSSAFYSLGNQYGGDARKTMKGHGRWRKDDRRGSRISSKWLAGKKGCYVCGENHLARTRHSQQKIRDAFAKMKSSRPSAYVTVTDLVNVIQDLTPEEHDANAVNIVYSSHSHEADSDEESEEEAAYIIQDDMSLHEYEEVLLANASFLHGTGYHRDRKAAIATMEEELSREECENFRGLYIDTCANRSSVMSYSQYKAYCEQFDVPCTIKRHNVKHLKGPGGSSTPVGTATIPVPFKDLNLVVDVTFQIVNENIPSLLSMKDMVENGMEISLQELEVMYKHLRQPLTFKNYFLIHNWNHGNLSYSLYTEAELRKLHRFFGLPSLHPFTNVLKRARPNEMNPEVRTAVEELTQSYLTCAKNASRPRRFKLIVSMDDHRFNHIVAIDMIYINRKPILHAVDEATHFNAAVFLRRMTSSEVWKAFLRCWSRLYLGLPNFLSVDQGSSFVSKEFLDLSDADGITVMPAPIESLSQLCHM